MKKKAYVKTMTGAATINQGKERGLPNPTQPIHVPPNLTHLSNFNKIKSFD